MIELSEWLDNKKQSKSNGGKLLQELIEKANPRCKLTTEESKRLCKLEDIADKLRHGEKFTKSSATNLVKHGRI